MTPHLRGAGWVTPLGTELDPVFARLLSGDRAEIKPLENPESRRIHPHIPVPPKLVEHLGRQPRLRRSSPLSYFAASAGLAALAQAGLTPEAARASRFALIFAVASGSVLYTRRFYEKVVKEGANAASPLLFPETVYNAPASHLAALLGIDGATYTLVGDNSVGFSALKMAEQLLAADEADYCLVAGTEEIDWVTCEGYRDWRFTASAQTPATLFANPARGAILSEGAAALLLAREGPGPRFTAIHPGVPFTTRGEAVHAIDQVCADLASQTHAAGQTIDAVISSANGSFTDKAEAAALRRHFAGVPVTAPKAAWGENLGAGALLHVIVAALALQNGELPPTLDASADAPESLIRERVSGKFQTSLILAAGLNQHVGGVLLTA